MPTMINNGYDSNEKFRPGENLELVKGTVLWNLNPGEIARRINVNEFESLRNAKGVYVQEGVVAVLMIDGTVATKLTSGVYYFDTGVEHFGGALRHIWRFFTGRKERGSANEDEIRRGRLGSELQNLGKSSLVDVILFAEGAIPVVFGIEATEDGHVFKEFTIHTKLEDVKVALSMHMNITDFYAFRKNYLTKRPYFRIADLQTILMEPIRNLLQEYLAYETIEEAVLPPNIKERIRRGLTEKLNTILYGISVRQIIDISINSEDFARFRELEHKLYCSNKELEYLIRTNDFKNRLSSEENSQKVREARSEEDLRYALMQLNKDSLLHDDEMEEFCQLLANQKAIREAQTDEDREKALQEIQKSRLIREDEFEDLQFELKKHHDKRVEVDLILHWQSLRRTETERVSAEKDIRLLTIDSEKAIEQAEYELQSQSQGHKNDIERTQANFDVEMNDLARGERAKEDDYQDHRRDEEHRRDILEDRDWTDNVDYEENKELDRVKKKQDIALAGMAKLREEDRADKAQDYDHEEKMADKQFSHEEAIEKILAGMSADQITAKNIESLSVEAQKAFAEAISVQKENEWIKTSTEERIRIIQELADRSAKMDKESREQMERDHERMMDFMKDVLKTNASVVSGAVAGQNASIEKTLNTMKDISTHRQDEVNSDKREAKEDARHAQARLDHTQDTSLGYTTKLASTEAMADAIKGNEPKGGSPIVFIIPSMDNTSASVADVLQLISDEEINPDTELIVDGQTAKAYDFKVLRGRLNKIYSVKCPNCGEVGLKGHLCPECHKQL